MNILDSVGWCGRGLVLWSCLATMGVAKDEGEKVGGALLFVNAVDDKGLAFLVLSGVDTNAAGFTAGTATEWVMLPEGEIAMEIEHQPLGKVLMEEKLKGGSAHALIAFPVMVAQERPGRPMRPGIEVMKLDCVKEGHFVKEVPKGKCVVVFVNVSSREEVEIEVGGVESVKVKRRATAAQVVELGGGFVPFRIVQDDQSKEDGEGEKSTEEGDELCSLNVDEDVIEFVVVYDQRTGGLGSVSFEGLRKRGDER